MKQATLHLHGIRLLAYALLAFSITVSAHAYTSEAPRNEPFRRLVEASQERDYQSWIPKIGQSINLDAPTQEFAFWWESRPESDMASRHHY